MEMSQVADTIMAGTQLLNDTSHNAFCTSSAPRMLVDLSQDLEDIAAECQEILSV